MIYPQELEQNINELLGGTRVRSLMFNIEGDLDAAGHRFLKGLAIDRMCLGAEPRKP